MKDEEMWLQGQYFLEALNVALSHFGAGLAGKKSNIEYTKKPYMHDIDEMPKTQEELDNIEIQRMILAEEQWITLGKAKGLPETIIKQSKQK